jgi:bifunctional ADP-heptose synthase (sugar kinase/adenylyltransferase)
MIKLDTRTKIVSTQEGARLAEQGATVVSGYFDPLLASDAGRLSQLKRPGLPLIVLIATPAQPILAARARAELLASLHVVDYVVESSDGIAEHFNLQQEGADRLSGLIEHVHARQRAAS